MIFPKYKITIEHCIDNDVFHIHKRHWFHYELLGGIHIYDKQSIELFKLYEYVHCLGVDNDVWIVRLGNTIYGCDCAKHAIMKLADKELDEYLLKCQTR